MTDNWFRSSCIQSGYSDFVLMTLRETPIDPENISVGDTPQLVAEYGKFDAICLNLGRLIYGNLAALTSFSRLARVLHNRLRSCESPLLAAALCIRGNLEHKR